MIQKYLVQVKLTPEQAALISPEVLLGDIRRGTENAVAMQIYDAVPVTVVREEMPEVFGPEMHFRPCDCGAWSGCKKCNGLGVIKFTPVS